MDFLPCGHISHSADEERRWASSEFASETKRQKGVATKLVAELKRRGPITLGPYPPIPNNYDATGS